MRQRLGNGASITRQGSLDGTHLSAPLLVLRFGIRRGAVGLVLFNAAVLIPALKPNQGSAPISGGRPSPDTAPGPPWTTAPLPGYNVICLSRLAPPEERLPTRQIRGREPEARCPVANKDNAAGSGVAEMPGVSD